MGYIFNLTELHCSEPKGHYYFERLDELCKASKQLYQSHLNLINMDDVESEPVSPDIIMEKLRGMNMLYNTVTVKIISHDSYSQWVSTSLI